MPPDDSASTKKPTSDNTAAVLSLLFGFAVVVGGISIYYHAQDRKAKKEAEQKQQQEIEINYFAHWTENNVAFDKKTNFAAKKLSFYDKYNKRHYTIDFYNAETAQIYWTPPNIAKYPKEYLWFCEGNCHKTLKELNDGEKTLASHREITQDKHDGAAKKSADANKEFNELKTAYEKAEKKDAFPFKTGMWSGKSYTRESAKRELINLHKRIDTQREIISKTETALRQLSDNSDKIKESRDKIELVLTDITNSRALLVTSGAADNIIKRISAIGDSVHAAAGKSTDIINDANAHLNLDEIVASQSDENDDAYFAKIMNK